MKLFVIGAFTAVSLFSQSPLSVESKAVYESIRNNIIRAAEKVPEANYSFRPTDEVRSFGQLVGHVADAQYLFCGPVKGGETPALNIEKTKSSKADLTAALKDAFAYCDAVYSSMTDEDAKANIKFFGRERSKLGVLYFNSAHNNEHYGNIVTYMRLKGMVPPSSEPRK